MNKVHTPLVREYGFQSPENFCSSNLESQILSFEIGNTPWGIRNPTDDWNTESKFHWPKKKKTNSCPWNPVLDSLTKGECYVYFFLSTLYSSFCSRLSCIPDFFCIHLSPPTLHTWHGDFCSCCHLQMQTWFLLRFSKSSSKAETRAKKKNREGRDRQGRKFPLLLSPFPYPHYFALTLTFAPCNNSGGNACYAG